MTLNDQEMHRMLAEGRRKSDPLLAENRARYAATCKGYFISKNQKFAIENPIYGAFWVGVGNRYNRHPKWVIQGVDIDGLEEAIAELPDVKVAT